MNQKNLVKNFKGVFLLSHSKIIRMKSIKQTNQPEKYSSKQYMMNKKNEVDI